MRREKERAIGWIDRSTRSIFKMSEGNRPEKLAAILEFAASEGYALVVESE